MESSFSFFNFLFWVVATVFFQGLTSLQEKNARTSILKDIHPGISFNDKNYFFFLATFFLAGFFLAGALFFLAGFFLAGAFLAGFFFAAAAFAFATAFFRSPSSFLILALVAFSSRSSLAAVFFLSLIHFFINFELAIDWILHIVKSYSTFRNLWIILKKTNKLG